MANRITNRTQFREYCARRIGWPVLNIDMDDDQVDDRIDEALRQFWLYHYDGHERIYYVHQVTSADHVNKFIELPHNINGAVRIMPISSAFSVGSVFSLQYQIVLQDMWRWSSVQLTQYYQIYQYTQLIEQILVGQQPIRFSEMNNRLYVDMDWNRVPVGNFMIVECFRVIDPDQLTVCLNTPTGTFEVDEAITTSGLANGTVAAINKQSLQELFLEDFNGTFNVGDTITGSTSLATATIAAVFDSTGVWNNSWLQKYASALIEQNWARNLTKFDRVILPSGAVLNGERIFQRASEDVAKLENELYTTFNTPSIDMIG